MAKGRTPREGTSPRPRSRAKSAAPSAADTPRGETEATETGAPAPTDTEHTTQAFGFTAAHETIHAVEQSADQRSAGHRHDSEPSAGAQTGGERRDETPSHPQTWRAHAIRDERGGASPSHDDIARRAYEIYRSRGEPDHDGRASQDDWLQAERELREGHQRRAS